MTKILIAEDGAIIAENIKNRLENMNYSVSRIVSNGQDAVKSASELDIDLFMVRYEIAIDVTKRDEAEEKLRPAADEWQATLNAITDLVSVQDKDFKILKVNKAYAEFFKVKPEEIIGKACYQVVHGTSEPWPSCPVKKALETKRSSMGEFFEPRSGIYFNESISPMLSENGDLIGCLHFFKEITELKEEEEALRESKEKYRSLVNDLGLRLHNILGVKEEKYRSLVNNLGLGIFRSTSEPTGKFLEVNLAMEEITGYSKKELLEMNVIDLYLHPEERAAFLAELTPATGKVTREMKFRKKDGTKIVVSETNVPVRNSAGKILYLNGIVEDITEHKQMELRLRERSDELEWVNKELEEDYTHVSHDLKAPLYSIQALSSFLIEDYGDKFDEQGMDYIEGLRNSSLRMQQLIDDLLSLSQVGKKDIAVKMTDLNLLLKKVKDDLRGQIDKVGAEIIIHDLPTISIQSIWIEQLFRNLIDNALKFNESKLPRVEIECEEREEDYLFKVSDNGIGIEEKYLSQIFTIFKRLHSQTAYGGGSGIGLTICKKIVENLEGKIWVQSRVGEGSIFYFNIPKVSKIRGKNEGKHVRSIEDTLHRG
ncbi:MAG: PAS domain S-box protein [Methanobacterium sp.]|jgi:PAS domain S-box-containing protein